MPIVNPDAAGGTPADLAHATCVEPIAAGGALTGGLSEDHLPQGLYWSTGCLKSLVWPFAQQLASNWVHHQVKMLKEVHPRIGKDTTAKEMATTNFYHQSTQRSLAYPSWVYAGQWGPLSEARL